MQNRLAHATSPYLIQHADNPVDWYPWGPEALERAQTEHKPILLSVGYSACHWCHVMAHESFEDPATAALMNQHFVNIKVDREERPDIDAIYQKVVALMGQGGGWPLTVFLLPDQRPFYAGTYFPPSDRYGRPSFTRVLTALAELWRDKRDEAERQAASFMAGFAELAAALDEDQRGAGADLSLTTAAAREQAVRRLLPAVDLEWGGFGTAPKFPNVPALNLLLAQAVVERGGPAGDALRLTLEKMWRGGIYDHLRGGFARYSTDREWLIPHFEKMLYDNGLLLGLYAEASVVFEDPGFLRRVVTETADYLEAEMRTEAGCFYSATDADSEGVEGKYFCWTPAELEQVLGAEQAAVLMDAHGIPTQAENFEHGMSVLHRPRPISPEQDAALAPARAKLLAQRQQRVPPLRDDKVLTAWNALVIRGLCRAATAAEIWGDDGRREQWTTLAGAAALGILDRHRDDDGRLLRASWQGRGHTRAYLEDVAGLALACLDLHELTLDPRWHDYAAVLGCETLVHYRRGGGGFYQSADDGERLIERSESLHDAPTPSGVAMAVEALARLDLGAAAGHAPPKVLADHGRAQIENTLARFRGAATRPSAHAGLILAAAWAGADATHVTIRAERFDAEAAKTLAAAVRRARPRLGVPVAQTFSPRPGPGADALVCRGQQCSMPITAVEPLLTALKA